MILAFDLATCTGWCEGAGDTLPQLGHVRMPDTKEEVGPFLDFFFRWADRKVCELLEELEHGHADDVGIVAVDATALVVVFEAPLLPKAKIDDRGHLRQAPTTIATTRKLQGLAGVLEMVCYRRRVKCREAHLQTVKKELAGNGRADKADMMAAAKRCGLAPKVEDEADAFGVWIVGMRAYARHFGPIWDRRLYSPAGGFLGL